MREALLAACSLHAWGVCCVRRAVGLLRQQVGLEKNGQTPLLGRNAVVLQHILRCPAHPAPGDWGSGDDRRLLRALLASGAAQEWQPDWGALVPGRTAAQVLPGLYLHFYMALLGLLLT